MRSHFYHHNIWKHVSAFADLFNDMDVYVYDKERKKVLGKKKVPVILAPKEKVVSVLSVIDGTPKPEIDNHLPKISIIWQGLSWDSARQTGVKQKRDLGIEYTNEEGEKTYKLADRQTIPYILEFQVTLWTVYLDESVQLLENILPFFHPDLHISLYERAAGIERKVKVELQSVTPNFVYELNEPDRRIIQFDLDFTMECNLYRPIEIDGVIEKAFIGIAAVDERSPHANEGDVIYTTSKGISGTLTDENIKQSIISFDEINNFYSNINIEDLINNLEVQKLNAINGLPPGTDESIVSMISETYDEQIRALGYSPPSLPYNALQYRTNLLDTVRYTREALLEKDGIVDQSFPMFYEDGYDELYETLTDDEKTYMDMIKLKYETRAYAIDKANEINEYIYSLVVNGDIIFTPGVDKRSAKYNYLFDSLG